MLTRAQREILALELEKPEYAEMMAAQNYRGVADMLNAPTFTENTEPPTHLPRRISVEDFVTAIKPGERVTVFQNKGLIDEYKAALAANNRRYSRKLWAGIKTLVSAESVAAVDALLDAQEPDPNYVTQIPGPSIAGALGLPLITPEDVQAVDVGLDALEGLEA